MTELVVVTYDLKTGGHSERRIKLNSKGRKWLTGHLTWCVNNARGVQIFNSDHERLAYGLAARQA